MRNDYYSNSKDYINRWVVSYSDFVTMLLALFMVMFAISQNVTKYQAKIIEENNLKVVENAANVPTKSVDDLMQELNKILGENSSVKLVKDNRGLIVRMNDSILFDEGSAIIKKNASKTLNEVIDVLAQVDNKVLVEGHTDSTPINTKEYPSNWELSTARATNIIGYILRTGKIVPQRLSAAGYGEYMPIADNTSSGGRLLNRRVDIIILK
ncbi:OmpA family protein [bacterium]|nr:OmpA family protein [bacterium]